MFRKLHTRLIISHTLPILILLPAIAIVLIYLLGSRRTIGDLADQLAGQGTLITEIAPSDTWKNPTEAAQVIDQVKSNITSRIMLLDSTGHLLASSLDTDKDRIGQLIDFATVRQAVIGQTNWLVDYSPFMRTRVLDMATPLLDQNNTVLGIVRLSYDVTAIEQRTIPLTWLIGLTFVIGMALALLLGLGLARSLNAPLMHLTQAVSVLTPGTYVQDLPENGPYEVKTVARSYNSMAHRLHELELTRQQLIANIVHELGTPLGAIKAAVEALHNGAVSDQTLAGELALGMNCQIDQIGLLIDDLALLGESEIKPISLDREWCNLEDLIQVECHTYAYLVKQKRISLAYNIKADLPLILADKRRLTQILANLVHNAYKYSPPGSSITVSGDMLRELNETSSHVIIEVADTGPGISPEEQEKIFDLLYRSPRERNLHKGMGIGLAVSKRLAECHGGSLTVNSVFGQGSTFRLSLPLS